MAGRVQTTALVLAICVPGCTADASRIMGGAHAKIGGSGMDADGVDADIDQWSEPPEAGDEPSDPPDADDGDTPDAIAADDGADGSADGGLEGGSDATADASDVAIADAGPADVAPDVTIHPTTVDDSVQGAGLNRFNYVGPHWQHCVACQINQDVPYFNQSNSWNNIINEYVTFTFVGTHIDFYGVRDPQHGIGAFSIDGGAEKMLDFYGPMVMGNQLIYSNDVPSGMHVFKLRVTGSHAQGSDAFVVPDRIDVW